jgi:formate hydrogenlyase transcriptional activator
VSNADDALRAELEDRLRFERLIADLSAEFVNLATDLIDGAIQDAQRRIVEFLDLDRSSLFQFSADDAELLFTHYWSRPEFAPPPLPSRPSSLFPWAVNKILKGEMVCFSSLREVPPDRPDRKNMESVGTKSNVTVPLIVSGRVVGAVAFAAMRKERQWTPDVINRLSAVGQVFANALARKRAEAELRRLLAENALLRDRLTNENVYLRHEIKVRNGVRQITGSSPAAQRVLQQIDQVAAATATVLLLGETGTGKELIATAIHERSPRASRAMVRVNCAAIPATLIESELFGHEKGAFTGALTRQIGRFEVADGSTIFLDEIGELSNEMQVKLLRVLQEKQVERLGSPRPIDIDVRVIAATNRDIERAVADGTFREDLYYRLNVFPITVPPLRERVEDIPTLAWSFADEFARALGKRIESIPKDQLLTLQSYPWPGNVRELRNVIERAVIVSTRPRLVIEPPRPRRFGPKRSVRLLDVEREHVQAVLESTNWRVRGDGGAAELLGLKPSTLEGRMAKLQIRRPPR